MSRRKRFGSVPCVCGRVLGLCADGTPRKHECKASRRPPPADADTRSPAQRARDAIASVEARGWSRAAVARMLGTTPQHVQMWIAKARVDDDPSADVQKYRIPPNAHNLRKVLALEVDVRPDDTAGEPTRPPPMMFDRMLGPVERIAAIFAVSELTAEEFAEAVGCSASQLRRWIAAARWLDGGPRVKAHAKPPRKGVMTVAEMLFPWAVPVEPKTKYRADLAPTEELELEVDEWNA